MERKFPELNPEAFPESRLSKSEPDIFPESKANGRVKPAFWELHDMGHAGRREQVIFKPTKDGCPPKRAERRRDETFGKQNTGNGETGHQGLCVGGRGSDVPKLGQRPGGDEVSDMAHP